MRNTFTSFNVDPNASRFSQFQLNSLRLEFLVKKLRMYLIFFILLHQQFNQNISFLLNHSKITFPGIMTLSLHISYN